MKIILINSLLIVSAALGFACGGNESVLKSGRSSPGPAAASSPQPSAFEQDLKDMLDTEYEYIFVIRRKDGAPLDDEDIAFIRANIVQVNRRVRSDADGAVLIGSNVPVPEDKMAAVYSRFAVENYSPKGATNTNAQP
jgi:hypothetical protein